MKDALCSREKQKGDWEIQVCEEAWSERPGIEAKTDELKEGRFAALRERLA
jgi:hypothetical protein